MTDCIRAVCKFEHSREAEVVSGSQGNHARISRHDQEQPANTDSRGESTTKCKLKNRLNLSARGKRGRSAVVCVCVCVFVDCVFVQPESLHLCATTATRNTCPSVVNSSEIPCVLHRFCWWYLPAVHRKCCVFVRVLFLRRVFSLRNLVLASLATPMRTDNSTYAHRRHGALNTLSLSARHSVASLPVQRGA